MSTEAALQRMEEKIDRIQQDVEFIKEDHGKKLEGHEDRFDRLEEAVVTNREMIAENREAITENQEKIDQVHQAVVLLEKVHGDKLEAVMDGYDIVSNRDYRLEQRLDMTRMCMDDFEQNFVRLETGQQEIKADVSEIKRNVERLVSIASDHEDRLQILEKKDGS
jgi:chromosome segregation ATPase